MPVPEVAIASPQADGGESRKKRRRKKKKKAKNATPQPGTMSSSPAPCETVPQNKNGEDIKETAKTKKRKKKKGKTTPAVSQAASPGTSLLAEDPANGLEDRKESLQVGTSSSV